MDGYEQGSSALPIVREFKLITMLSIVIVVLVTTASVAGLVNSSVVYPTDELFRAFVPNDVVNIIIGLPFLLGSLWLSQRAKLLGLLSWPGALFFFLYTYLVYVFAMPPNAAFLLHLGVVTLSLYTLIGLISAIDGQAVQQRLAGAVPARLSGGVLAGLGLLFQAGMLFIGLIVVLILQPWLVAVPFALVDVIVVFIMGLVCFVPFGLFVQGIVATQAAALHT